MSFFSCKSKINPNDDLNPDIDVLNDDEVIQDFLPSGWITQFGLESTLPGRSNTESEQCLSVTSDREGNIICGGVTNGNMADINNGLYEDMVFLKLSPEGSVSWVKQLGESLIASGIDTSERDYCYSVATDSMGNIYCGGFTDGSLGEANGGNSDAIVIKMNPNGDILWITQLGADTKVLGGDNSNDEICFSIVLDDNDNVYCGGHSRGNFAEQNGGMNDLIIFKLNSSGELQWAKQLGDDTLGSENDNSSNEACYGIDLDSSGNIYCAGATAGSFGELKSGNTDAFITKFDNQGNLLWITQLGSETKLSNSNHSRSERCLSITVDPMGNVFCSGYTLSNMGEVRGGGTDAFVLKLNTLGELQWIRQLGQVTGLELDADTTLVDSCNSIDSDLEGNLYCAGETQGKIGENNGGVTDAFVFKLNQDGEVDWVTQLGESTKVENGDNSKYDHCNAVHVDQEKNIFCAGYTKGSLGETNAGNIDIFVLKLNSDGKL